jgi:hypothetical protein
MLFCEGTYGVEGDLLEVCVEVPAKRRRSPKPATQNGAGVSDPPPHPTSLPPSRSGIADIPVCTGVCAPGAHTPVQITENRLLQIKKLRSFSDRKALQRQLECLFRGFERPEPDAWSVRVPAHRERSASAGATARRPYYLVVLHPGGVEMAQEAQTAAAPGFERDVVFSSLRDFLELAIPSDGWHTIAECSERRLFEMTCYNSPDTYAHLAPVTWFGTARLLVICATVQVFLMLVALACDLIGSVAVRCRQDADPEHVQTGYTPLHVFLDSVDVGLSLASCITFVVRAYETPAYDERIMMTVYVVDWAIAVAVMIFYVVRWTKAESKLQYSIAKQPLISVFTVTSASLVQVVDKGWVPFTFLRALTMNTALTRLFKMWDLPELYEQLTLAFAEFFGLIFSFAGIIFMLENLGNPPGWSIEESANLSFAKSMWYVTVTVSTVGYGDIFPKSFLGKVAGIVFILVGVYFFSSNIARISGLLQSQADGHGRYDVKSGKAHVVLTGCVEPVTLRDFALEFFHREHDKHRKGGMHLCLMAPNKVDIERYILSGQISKARLQMLRGSLPTDLDRIAMPRVHALFFVGDTRHPNPTQHDSELLLRAFTAQKEDRKVKIYVTLLDPESLTSASDTVALCYTTFKTGLLSTSTFCPGIIPLIGNLLVSVDPRSLEATARHGKGKRLTREYLYGLQHEIYKVSMPSEFRGQKFGEVVLHNFATYGILIFALGTKAASSAVDVDAPLESIAVHPGYEHEIHEAEQFAFVIAQDDPQDKIVTSVKSFFAQMRSDEYEDLDEDSPQDTPRSVGYLHQARTEGDQLFATGAGFGAGRYEEEAAETGQACRRRERKIETNRGSGPSFTVLGASMGQPVADEPPSSGRDRALKKSIDDLYALGGHKTLLPLARDAPQRRAGGGEQPASRPPSASMAASGSNRSRANRVHPMPPEQGRLLGSHAPQVPEPAPGPTGKGAHEVMPGLGQTGIDDRIEHGKATAELEHAASLTQEKKKAHEPQKPKSLMQVISAVRPRATKRVRHYPLLVDSVSHAN